MGAKAIKKQSFISVVVGIGFFAIGLASGNPGNLAYTAACVAFVGIGVLGFVVARTLHGLEERVARLEQTRSQTTPDDSSGEAD